MTLYEITIKHNKTRKTLTVLNNVQRIDYDLMPLDGVCGSSSQYIPCYRITLCGKCDISIADNGMVNYVYHNPIVLWYAYFVDIEVVKIGL